MTASRRIALARTRRHFAPSARARGRARDEPPVRVPASLVLLVGGPVVLRTMCTDALRAQREPAALWVDTLRGCPRSGSRKGRKSMFSTRVSIALAIAGLAVGAGACGDDGGGGGSAAAAAAARTDDLLEPAAPGRRPARRRWRRSTAPSSRSSRPEARSGTSRSPSSRSTTRPRRPAGWEPGATSANARKAASDDSAIGYIGEFNSGATAVSLPILNESGVAQVSPGNTAVGITSDDPGAEPGEPDKYYPSGERTYARVLPKDTYQGAAIVALAKEEGCASAYILNDKEVYGAGLAKNVELAAKDERAGDQGRRRDRQGRGQLPLARRRRSPASAPTASSTPASPPTTRFSSSRTWRWRCPRRRCSAPRASARPASSTPSEGGLPPDVAKRVRITIPGVAPEEYPPAGKQFLKDYTAKYGEKDPDRYAVYGYESMSAAARRDQARRRRRRRPRGGRRSS